MNYMQACAGLVKKKGSGSSYDTDAQEFFTRADAAGTLSSGTKTLVDAFVVAAKAHSYWTKMRRINLLCGDFSVAMVPLLKTWGATLDVVTNLTGSDYGESTGLKGNGTNGRLDTGVAINTLTVGDFHLMFAGASIETTYVSEKTLIGYRQASPFASAKLWSIYTSDRRRFRGGATEVSHNATVPASEVKIGSQISTTDTKIFSNGTQVGTASGGAGSAFSESGNIYVLAANHAGTAQEFTAAYCRGYSIGMGLTGQNVTDLTTDIEAFNDGLSRGVI